MLKVPKSTNHKNYTALLGQDGQELAAIGCSPSGSVWVGQGRVCRRLRME